MSKINSINILILIIILIWFPISKGINVNNLLTSKTVNQQSSIVKTNVNENNEEQVMAERQNVIQVRYNKLLEDYDNQKRLDLENQIKNYLGNNINSVGLSFYDINSGKTIEINGDKTFIAGSTVKVQMNMVLCDMFENGQISMEEKLQYTEDCYEEGTGILQGQDLSNPIPISLLSEYSITHSDNIATNMIIKRIGYENMRSLIDDKLGHPTDHSGNYITANDETELLSILYNCSKSNPFYSKIIEYMKKTDFHDRLDLYVPQDIVAHKIGDYNNYVNDVGIVYSSKPYILSIYTNEVPNANQVIANISKMIYDYENQ